MPSAEAACPHHGPTAARASQARGVLWMAEGAGPSLARGASQESLDILTTRKIGRRTCWERKVPVMVSSPRAPETYSPGGPGASCSEVPPPHSRAKEPPDLTPEAAFPVQPAGEDQRLYLNVESVQRQLPVRFESPHPDVKPHSVLCCCFEGVSRAAHVLFFN